MTLLSLTASPVKLRAWFLQAGVTLGAVLCAVLLVRVGLHQPLYALGTLYVAGFLTLAWKRPQWALLSIFAAAPFQTDVGGGGFAKFSMAEVNLTLTFPVLIAHLLIKRRLPAVGPLILPVLLYMGICAYSSSIHWRGQDAVISLFQMALYFFVAVSVFASFVERLEDMRIALYALVCIGVFLTGAAVATSFSFMGMNKNGLGSSLACAVLVCVELWLAETKETHRRWLMAALAILAAGLLLSLSRGAWLGTALGLLAIFGLRQQWKALGRLLIVLLPLLTLCWYSLPSERRDYATGIGRDRTNIELRYKSVDIAKVYFTHSPLIGEGVGLRKEYDATNIVWMVLAETGMVGLVAFGLIHLVFFHMIGTARRRMMPSDATFSFLTVGAALILNQVAHGLVDHYWSRGALMTAWAAAGMATGVYLAQRRSPAVGQGQMTQ